MSARHALSAGVRTGRAGSLAVLLAVSAMACAAADGQKADAINDYLVNQDAGAVSAAEILGMTGSAVSTAHTVKDLVGAFNAASGDGGKAGFGISFAPARSSIDGLSMPMENYLSGSYLARAWGNTALSYAQNRKTIGGIEYKQDAIALRTILYMDDARDPVRASHAAFKNADCRQAAGADDLRKAAEAEVNRLGRPLTAAERQALKEKIDNLPLTAPIRAALIKDADKQASCIKEAVKAAAALWNATQVSLTVGQGWIVGPGAADPRLSLARHVSLSGVWGPNEDSVMNLTVRRVDKDLVLNTIAGTPQFKSSTLVAFRYTVGLGADRKLYALAEVSNARNKDMTSTNTAFKSAVGLDAKLGDNMWLEFRYGHASKESGGATQNVGLLNLKIAPSSGLASLGR